MCRTCAPFRPRCRENNRAADPSPDKRGDFTGALPEGQIKAFLDKHVPVQDILEAEVTGVEVSDAPAADDPVAVRDPGGIKHYEIIAVSYV